MALLHELAIKKIMARKPDIELHTKGLGKFFRGLDKKYGFGIEPDDMLRRIPDAWSYEPFNDDDIPGTLNLYEVEDSHQISESKMRDYADFAFMCDFYDLDVCLFVYDRYGEIERKLSLIEYFCMFMVKDYGPGGPLHGAFKSTANDNELTGKTRAAA